MSLLLLASPWAYAPARTPLSVRKRAFVGAVEKADGFKINRKKFFQPNSEEDPLKAKRPQYGLAPASGRPTEVVFGVDVPAAAELPAWSEHLRSSGIERLLYVYDEGSADEHVAGLCGEGGFAADAVLAVDVRADGAAERTADAMQAASSARAKIGVHGPSDSLVLAQWVLTDYIGSDNCLEACDLLNSRKRFSGVEWKPEVAALQRYLGYNEDGSRPPDPRPHP